MGKVSLGPPLNLGPGILIIPAPVPSTGEAHCRTAELKNRMSWAVGVRATGDGRGGDSEVVIKSPTDINYKTLFFRRFSDSFLGTGVGVGSAQLVLDCLKVFHNALDYLEGAIIAEVPNLTVN